MQSPSFEIVDAQSQSMSAASKVNSGENNSGKKNSSGESKDNLNLSDRIKSVISEIPADGNAGNGSFHIS